MRKIVIIAAAVGSLAGSLAGCSSSGSGASPDSSSRAPQTTRMNTRPAASPIVDNYDTATCADWEVTKAKDRQILVLYYATKYNDPQPAEDAESLTQIITTTCKAYGVKETPSHIAKVSIATIYGGS